ncbi:MAG: MFS transporter, partial [SAR202 cluster bacterium]|nr:MFS transporter [SAR202 cluster bacterium]
RAYTLGFLIYSVGLGLCAISGNVGQLIAFRILQGIGSALVLANVVAIIMPAFAKGERGRAMGIQGAVVGIGLSTGPLLGGVLLDALDWRALFYMRLPVSVLGIAVAWFALPDDRPVKASFRVDYLGAASLFAVLSSALLLVNRGAQEGWTSPVALSMAVVLPVTLPLLVWTQRRSIRPILDFALFRRFKFSAALGVLMSHYLSQGPILVIAPFFFIDALGFSATKMGLFLMAFPLMRVFLSPLTGALSDRMSAWLLSGFGLVMMGSSLLWLSFLGTGASQWHILAGLGLAGLGSAFYEPPNTHTIMAAVPPDRHGTASASIASGRQLSFSIGVTLAGAIYAIRERAYLASFLGAGSPADTAAREAISHGFSNALIGGAVIAFIGVALSLYSAKKEGRPERIGAPSGS